MITLRVSTEDERIGLDASTPGDSVALGVSSVHEVVTDDYAKLKNLPKLDGITIIGNVSEKDPTVPSWAKTTNKPNYTAEEVNAVDNNAEITTASIDAMMSAIFG